MTAEWVEQKENLKKLEQKHAQLITTLKRHRGKKLSQVNDLLDSIETDLAASENKSHAPTVAQQDLISPRL